MPPQGVPTSATLIGGDGLLGKVLHFSSATGDEMRRFLVCAMKFLRDGSAPAFGGQAPMTPCRPARKSSRASLRRLLMDAREKSAARGTTEPGRRCRQFTAPAEATMPARPTGWLLGESLLPG